jgi:hypothetical protein
MKNKILIGLIGLFVIMVGLIIYVSYRSNPLAFEEMMMAPLPIEKERICSSFSREQITTYDEYNDFLEACEIQLSSPLEEAYFNENTLVILLKESNEQITHFYDYGFMLQETEIITYRSKKQTESTLKMYVIYADRDDIESEDVLFDKIN